LISLLLSQSSLWMIKWYNLVPQAPQICKFPILLNWKIKLQVLKTKFANFTQSKNSITGVAKAIWAIKKNIYVGTNNKMDILLEIIGNSEILRSRTCNFCYFCLWTGRNVNKSVCWINDTDRELGIKIQQMVLISLCFHVHVFTNLLVREVKKSAHPEDCGACRINIWGHEIDTVESRPGSLRGSTVCQFINPLLLKCCHLKSEFPSSL
jgi:hypothetical protein